jgi:hypothetical protein
MCRKPLHHGGGKFGSADCGEHARGEHGRTERNEYADRGELGEFTQCTERHAGQHEALQHEDGERDFQQVRAREPERDLSAVANREIGEDVGEKANGYNTHLVGRSPAQQEAYYQCIPEPERGDATCLESQIDSEVAENAEDRPRDRQTDGAASVLHQASAQRGHKVRFHCKAMPQTWLRNSSIEA